tara:strand:+ start:702 stop:914 length:213 start_codon:yes stop_codon:yes gene_type:complete
LFNDIDLIILSGLILILCYCSFLIGKRSRDENIVTTIDTLVQTGFLRTKGSGKKMEIMKWDEVENNGKGK